MRRGFNAAHSPRDILWVVALACALWPGPSRAGDATVEQVEAAYLYKFIGYIEWSAQASAEPAPLTVGIAGSDRVYQEFARIAQSRTVAGRTVQVRQVTKTEQVLGCQMLFVGRDDWGELADWVDALKTQSVAVVTDSPRGVEQGALLTFVRVGDRVRFEASLAVGRKAGLKLSSRLLEVAERVWENQP